MSLTPRENLLKLWRREGFEYVPAHFWLCPSLIEEFKQRYGNAEFYVDKFNFPFRYVGAAVKENKQDWTRYYPGVIFNPGTKIGDDGVAHEPHSGSMHMTRMHHPMKNFTSLDEFKAYPYPELRHDCMEQLIPAVQSFHDRGLAVMGSPGSIWENSWAMRSMEELMMDMMTGDEKAVYHLDRITELVRARVVALAGAGVDFIHLGDDIGMQHAIMMSEELYRAWLKPRFAQVIKAAKAVKPDLLFSYHSCGYVEPFIPDLIEIGVDILNPVQPECMSFEKIHAEYGDVLSFWGTIGTQTTMPFGKPEDVRREVLRNLKIAGGKGGLLCTPTHLIEPEVPWANIEAYLQACRDFKL
ncbi:MAG: uroporphyrinogen decarboxylase family protein [Victivallaceae bacterium]|jgi:uroporphyrinogen decarboxylase